LPPYLKQVTTLPCETSAADTFDYQQVTLMMFVSVSKFGKTNLIFIDPGSVILSQRLIAHTTCPVVLLI